MAEAEGKEGVGGSFGRTPGATVSLLSALHCSPAFPTPGALGHTQEPSLGLAPGSAAPHRTHSFVWTLTPDPSTLSPCSFVSSHLFSSSPLQALVYNSRPCISLIPHALRRPPTQAAGPRFVSSPLLTVFSCE